MKQQKSLDTLIYDTTDYLSDVAHWPDVASRRELAANSIKLLRAALAGYPPVVLRSTVAVMGARLASDVELRESKPEGFKAAWLMLGDLIAEG